MSAPGNLAAQVEAFLRRKYVIRADARQASMGLSYVEAETTDLAKEITRFIHRRDLGLLDRLEVAL